MCPPPRVVGTLACRSSRQQLLTFQVSSFCLLALQSSTPAENRKLHRRHNIGSVQPTKPPVFSSVLHRGVPHNLRIYLPADMCTLNSYPMRFRHHRRTMYYCPGGLSFLFASKKMLPHSLLVYRQ